MAKGTMNKTMLIGRLGQDPEVRYTQSGKAVATLSIATNETWKGQDGQKQERTDWHRCVAWGKLAEIMGEYLQKGSLIFVEGRLQTRSYEDANGVKKYTTEVVVGSMEMLGGKGQGSGKSSQGASQGASPEPPLPMDEDDDLPF